MSLGILEAAEVEENGGNDWEARGGVVVGGGFVSGFEAVDFSGSLCANANLEV